MYGIEFYFKKLLQRKYGKDKEKCVCVTEIRMKCLGWGEVHWTQTIQSGGPGQKPKSETVHYNGEENYFKSILALYGKGTYLKLKINELFSYYL